MTLNQMKIGDALSVASIRLRDDTARRLEMLGLTRGTQVLLLNAKKSGAVIIKVRDTRFALGKEIAQGIEVKPLD